MGLEPHVAALQAELRTTIQTSRTGSIAYNRRKENVEWIRRLPMEGLAYRKTEMQIPMVETTNRERIFIQIPGKESTESSNRAWISPWDFRPKLLGHEDKDLSFQKIWDPLMDNLRKTETDKSKWWIATTLATLFYRMAYMLDFERRPADEHQVNLISGSSKETRTILLGAYWVYRPPIKPINAISEILDDWTGMSLEAFLHYNNLLAWNEDNKSLAKFKGWTPAKRTGRVNTLLTHVRVIGFILDKVKPSALFGTFASQRGMSPAATKELREICNPFIT